MKLGAIGRTLLFAGATAAAITGAASTAEAAPCNTHNEFHNAVIDDFQSSTSNIPADYQDLAASRYRIDSMKISTRESGGNSDVSFAINGGDTTRIQCEGKVTDVPGLENYDQGARAVGAGVVFFQL